MNQDQKKKPLQVDINLKADVPGLKPLSETVGTVTEKTADGALRFLSSICGRASSQVGALFEDKVRYWRYYNLLKFSAKAEKMHKELNVDMSHEIHPRMLIEIVEGAAKQENDDLLDWWAGLTISSCDKEPTDQDLIFTNLMGKITCLQKNIITFACKTAKIVHSPKGLIIAEELTITDEDIIKISGTSDFNVIDRELDSLAHNGLLTLTSGFNFASDEEGIKITPTALSLHFFARCNGIKGDLKKFYKSENMPICPHCNKYHSFLPCLYEPIKDHTEEAKKLLDG